MSGNQPDDLSNLSMLQLFRMEVDTQSTVLTSALLALERDPDSAETLQSLMRAAHSLKGAARIVGRQAAARIAHAMEDCVVAAQKGTLTVTVRHIDAMLDGLDRIGRISRISDEEFESWQSEHNDDIDAFISSLADQTERKSEAGTPPPGKLPSPTALSGTSETSGKITATQPRTEAWIEPGDQSNSLNSQRVLRVTADNLNRLLGLAGETRVASRWLDDFVAESAQVRQLQRALTQSYESTMKSFTATPSQRRAVVALGDLHDRMTSLQSLLATRIAELEQFDRQFINLSARLYQEVLNCRMRPFADGVQAFPRMVRDLAQSLGKTVRLEVIGESTNVDRDILERLQAPLDHLLRNAIDHGIESPAERRSLGKPEHGTVQLEARHSAGMLLITIRDDGRGIDPEMIRQAVIEKKLSSAEMAKRMSQAELFEFLFLPGFTLKETVSEISGRGVGLDVVQAMHRQVGGSVRVSASKGAGTSFVLELPLTLSVIRTLLVEIGGEPYAFPLARIDTVLKVPQEKIQSLEARQHFSLGDQQIGLVAASQILQLEPQPSSGDVCVVVLGQKASRYGVVVDRFLDEQELVVRPLDPRLGKVNNISAASLMPDGTP
jgi:two-component system sensor histidine kinase and response regulator WspE